MINKVSDVPMWQKALPEEQSILAIKHLTKIKKIESCSDYDGKYITCYYNPFMAASYSAFEDHRTLILSPDMIWLLIAQGIAQHVKNNSELLRSKFVTFNDKLKITVIRDGFIKGSIKNDWPSVFSEFSERVKNSMVEGVYDKLNTSFSTTGEIEKIANEIVLLDTVQNYFELEVLTRCGIPFIIQEGNIEDWKLLEKKIKELADYFDLDWWFNLLIPVVEKMVSSANGRDETIFWKNWFKLDDESGGPYITGNIMYDSMYTQWNVIMSI